MYILSTSTIISHQKQILGIVALNINHKFQIFFI